MIVYGKNVAKEILASDVKVLKAVIDLKNDDNDIVRMLKENNIPIFYKDKRELDMLVDGMHQGIILYVEDYKYADIEDIKNDDKSLIVILDHLEDPHNLGAIIRTVEAAGVNGIIIPKDRSVSVNSTVMKISAGALVNVKIVQVANLVSAIEDLKKSGYWVAGTKMDAVDNYDNFEYPSKTALIIGNEGSGISRLVGESCDFFVKIPMYGKINSLNASVSAGIFIYEVIQNRK